MTEVVAARDRSIVTRTDAGIRKQYRCPDPRNNVERAAYAHLADVGGAPVPRLLSVESDAIVLEDVGRVGDFEHALRAGNAERAAYDLGRAYAALHEVPAPGPVAQQRLATSALDAWCAALDVPPLDVAESEAVFAEPGSMLAFSHGDPAPSNALVRADGTIVLIDFEYAGARHRGYDIAAWHVLCPLDEALLDALHAGYGVEIDELDAMIRWRAAQVIAMVPLSVLETDRDFVPGWSSRCAVTTAARRGGFDALHGALAPRWPESADRLPEWR